MTRAVQWRCDVGFMPKAAARTVSESLRLRGDCLPGAFEPHVTVQVESIEAALALAAAGVGSRLAALPRVRHGDSFHRAIACARGLERPESSP
jgi:hypothetical protein